MPGRHPEPAPCADEGNDKRRHPYRHHSGQRRRLLIDRHSEAPLVPRTRAPPTDPVLVGDLAALRGGLTGIAVAGYGDRSGDVAGQCPGRVAPVQPAVQRTEQQQDQREGKEPLDGCEASAGPS